MKLPLISLAMGLAAIVLAACDGGESMAPEPASETYRLDLAPDVVAAFVEGLTPEMSKRVAYVTHVPSGTQAILGRDGKVIHRHDGRADGPGRLDAVLGDRTAMVRIQKGLTDAANLRPQSHTISWVPMMRFNGVRYGEQWRSDGQETPGGERGLEEGLGPELYRIAFRGDGYVGPYYLYQDGDATYLNPGTQVYAVKGYSPSFRLGTLEDGRATLYEADTNPLARTGEDLLDIRGKVKSIDILSEEDARTVLGTIDEEQTVERFVDIVLGSPVDQENRDHDGPRYFVGLRLADGTSVVRAFWLDSGELSRGIMTDPMAASIVSSALPDN